MEELVVSAVLDADARVSDMHSEQVVVIVIASVDSYQAFLREFERVLDQIDKDLLQTTLVAFES